MTDVLLSVELGLGIVLGLGLFYLLTLIGRRRVISRGSLLTLCGFAPDGGRWRQGLLRFGAGSIEWFPLHGLSLRPGREWGRRELELGSPTPLPDGAHLDLTDALCVPCRHLGASFHLALAHSAYTALRSWVEAAPPGATSEVH